MKLGKMEGTPHEITNIIENNGLQLSDFVERTEEPLSKGWLTAPALLLGLTCVLLVVLNPLQRAYSSLLFLLGFACTAWLTIAVQIRFKNAAATFVAAIAGIMLLLIALGLVEPKESIDMIKSIKGSKAD